MNRTDRFDIFRMALIAVLIVLLASWRPAFALERPSAAFCWAARGAVATAGSERAAEQEARARGVSEATIAKAKLCRR